MLLMTEYKPFTAAGLKALQAEFDDLWKRERPEVVRRLSDAAAEGDRSENAEYIYGKKRLRELDSRLHYLGKLLESARVVSMEHQPRDSVAFGAAVTYSTEDATYCWRIVGEGEADPARGTISYRTPVALALMGRQIGDGVAIRLGDRVLEAEIEAIEYPDA